jgi:calcineurin-like phosphoesterase family protein
VKHNNTTYRASALELTTIHLDISTLLPETTWFVSDPHFDHTNIIKYCYRPFMNKEEMNKTILENWNSRIELYNVTFFLGDMAFGRESREPLWWAKLVHGNIYYVKGSHDNGVKSGSLGTTLIRGIYDYITLEYKGLWFALIHDPDRLPNNVGYDWLIHGHHHSNNLIEYPLIDRKKHKMNLSMELTGYCPVNLTKIMEWINNVD